MENYSRNYISLAKMDFLCCSISSYSPPFPYHRRLTFVTLQCFRRQSRVLWLRVMFSLKIKVEELIQSIFDDNDVNMCDSFSLRLSPFTHSVVLAAHRIHKFSGRLFSNWHEIPFLCFAMSR